MLPLRRLPPGLSHALLVCRRVEHAADTPARRASAISATSRLLRLAFEAGWRATELGPALHMAPVTVRARVASDRGRGLPPEGLVVEPPASPTPMKELHRIVQVPVTQRQWLTLAEACELAGVNRWSLANWRHAGLLPNTRRPYGSVAKNLYLRADLERVLAAPRYRNHGPSYAAVREAIAGNGGI